MPYFYSTGFLFSLLPSVWGCGPVSFFSLAAVVMLLVTVGFIHSYHVYVCRSCVCLSYGYGYAFFQVPPSAYLCVRV